MFAHQHNYIQIIHLQSCTCIQETLIPAPIVELLTYQNVSSLPTRIRVRPLNFSLADIFATLDMAIRKATKHIVFPTEWKQLSMVTWGPGILINPHVLYLNVILHNQADSRNAPCQSASLRVCKQPRRPGFRPTSHRA